MPWCVIGSADVVAPLALLSGCTTHSETDHLQGKVCRAQEPVQCNLFLSYLILFSHLAISLR